MGLFHHLLFRVEFASEGKFVVFFASDGDRDNPIVFFASEGEGLITTGQRDFFRWNSLFSFFRIHTPDGTKGFLLTRRTSVLEADL
ncbi:hypothetical protein ACE6H2_023203 [Prunus campanulata]